VKGGAVAGGAPDGAVRVRDAVREDVPVLADFNARLALESEGKTLDPMVVRRGVTRVLAEPFRGRFWVAVAPDGAIAGQCLVTLEWSDWRDADCWYLQSVYVPPEHRRRGVLRAMYAHVQAEARRAGAQGLRLYVERANDVARRAYETLGMKVSHYVMMEDASFVAGD